MGFSKLNLHEDSIKNIAQIANVLGHPARVVILNYISTHPNCICNNLVEYIGLAQATISQHLAEIRSINVLNIKHVGKRVEYNINEEQLNISRRLINDFFVKIQVNCSK